MAEDVAKRTPPGFEPGRRVFRSSALRTVGRRRLRRRRLFLLSRIRRREWQWHRQLPRLRRALGRRERVAENHASIRRAIANRGRAVGGRGLLVRRHVRQPDAAHPGGWPRARGDAVGRARLFLRPEGRSNEGPDKNDRQRKPHPDLPRVGRRASATLMINAGGVPRTGSRCHFASHCATAAWRKTPDRSLAGVHPVGRNRPPPRNGAPPR